MIPEAGPIEFAYGRAHFYSKKKIRLVKYYLCIWVNLVHDFLIIPQINKEYDLAITSVFKGILAIMILSSVWGYFDIDVAVCRVVPQS